MYIQFGLYYILTYIYISALPTCIYIMKAANKWASRTTRKKLHVIFQKMKSSNTSTQKGQHTRREKTSILYYNVYIKHKAYILYYNIY